MELRTLLDWTVAYRLRSVPGVVEVNGMGGEAKQYQVVLDPQAPRRIPPVAAARRAGPRGEQRLDRRRLRRAARRIVRDPQRGPVPLHRGHREHRARLRSGRHAGAAQERRDRAHRAGAALRRRHQVRRGGDRRRDGHDADRRELARGGRGGQATAGARFRPSCRPACRDPQLLRPRRVHQPDAQDGRHQPRRRARCWSWSSCS